MIGGEREASPVGTVAAPDGWQRPRRACSVPSPLELSFDLTFVVAAAELHHALVEDHVAHAVVGYVIVFFGIWWAWATGGNEGITGFPGGDPAA